MLNITTNSILSGPGVKSWVLATPGFWQYAAVAVAVIASLSHQKLELHLLLCIPLKADLHLKGSLSEQQFH